MKKIISAALSVVLMLGTLFLASCEQNKPATQAANGTQKTAASTAAPTEATIETAPATTAPTTIAPTTAAKTTKKPTKKQSATKAKSTKKVSDKVSSGFKPPIGGKKPPVTVKKPTTTKKSTTSTTKKAVANTYYMGQVSDAGVYTNKFADIKLDFYHFPAYECGIGNAEYLADLTGCSASVYKNDTSYKKFLDSNGFISDLWAEDSHDNILTAQIYNLKTLEVDGIDADEFLDMIIYIYNENPDVKECRADQKGSVSISGHEYCFARGTMRMPNTHDFAFYARIIDDYAYLICSICDCCTTIDDFERFLTKIY